MDPLVTRAAVLRNETRGSDILNFRRHIWKAREKYVVRNARTYNHCCWACAADYSNMKYVVSWQNCANYDVWDTRDITSGFILAAPRQINFISRTVPWSRAKRFWRELQYAIIMERNELCVMSFISIFYKNILWQWIRVNRFITYSETRLLEKDSIFLISNTVIAQNKKKIKDILMTNKNVLRISTF